MNKPTKPLSVDDEWLAQLYLSAWYNGNDDTMEMDPWLDQAKAHLIELVERLPELQEVRQVRDNFDSVVIEPHDNKLRREIKQALIKAIEGDPQPQTVSAGSTTDAAPHLPGTTDEPVAPEYKDARWGKPK